MQVNDVFINDSLTHLLSSSPPPSPGQGPCCAPSCVFQNPSVMCADDTACALPSNCRYPYLHHTPI